MSKAQYGDQVIVNLLGNKEGEDMLSKAFQVSSVWLQTTFNQRMSFQYNRVDAGLKLDSN